jgi:hypothetical protein
MFRKPSGDQNETNTISIPMDSITSQDIEKLLVRSAIIASPFLWSKYATFISPLTIEGNMPSLFNRFIKNVFNKIEADFFDECVNELKELKKQYDVKTDLSLADVETHLNKAADITLKFCKEAEARGISHNIFPQLETITANLKSRKPVLTYATKRTGYGSMDS